MKKLILIGSLVSLSITFSGNLFAECSSKAHGKMPISVEALPSQDLLPMSPATSDNAVAQQGDSQDKAMSTPTQESEHKTAADI